MRVRQMIRAMYSAKAVYELRKTPLFVTVFVAIILGILQMTPFTIRFFGTHPYRFDLQMWELDYEEKEQLLLNLPEDCYISNATFICNEMESFVVSGNVSIHFNGDSSEVVNGIIFMEQSFIFVAGGQDYALSYRMLDGLNFGHLQRLDNGYEVLFSRIAEELRGVLIVPFVLGVYQTGILTFYVYVLGVSALAMLLRFGHSSFISFKEVINIIVYASILPIIFVIIIGLITPAFTTIIFNMGVPLWAYVVYKKYVILGLSGSSNEEIEKKECETL